MTSNDSGECCIWPAHKLVCGPLAVPFRWPKLSEEELEDALQHKDYVPIPYSECARDFSISGMLQKYGLTAEMVEIVLRAVARPSCQTGHYVPPCWREYVLETVRGLRYHRNDGRDTPASGNGGPFAMCAAWTCSLRLPPSEVPPMWYTQLHHHLLVFTTLFSLYTRKPSDSLYAAVLVAFRHAKECLEQEVATADAPGAALALDRLKESIVVRFS
ncbi:hypothetical protein JCM10213v2_006506 [Rhodosporidiobolus nylandii]